MSSNTTNKEIYLDHAAATPIDKRVQAAMLRAQNLYGNPSSYNDSGREAATELLRARTVIARFIGASPQEIVFTASGSEANSLAIRGALQAIPKLDGQEVVVTPIEHPSVLSNVAWARTRGALVRSVPVAGDGSILPEDVISLVTSRTTLVSVMYANNEIGTVEPIARVGRLLKDKRIKLGSRGVYPIYHVDACQAAGYLDMNVQHLGVDLMTFNGSKIYGPRGIGVLYVRKGLKISPLIRGGNQEHGLRAGTENLPAIVGLAKAVELIDLKENIRLTSIRDYFFSEIKKVIPEVMVYGAEGDRRLAGNINISIPGIESEYMLLELDRYGIRAGSGSACTARSVEPSHVLKAIGAKKGYINGALRFSMGRTTTKRDIEYLLKVLPKIIKKLRRRFQ